MCFLFFLQHCVCVHSSVERLASHNATFLTFCCWLIGCFFLSYSLVSMTIYSTPFHEKFSKMRHFYMERVHFIQSYIHTPACVYCCRKILQFFFCFMFIFSINFSFFTLDKCRLFFHLLFGARKNTLQPKKNICASSLHFCFHSFFKRKALYLFSRNFEKTGSFAIQKLNEKQTERVDHSFTVET